MSIRFIHTADWQLGKPFASIEDPAKRALVQQERLEVIGRIGQVAASHEAEFILIAGDLFDSVSPTKETVAAACSAIGLLKLPVFVIPGNHDHAGPGSLWEQRFFLSQRDQLAPNLRVLLKPEPVELDTAVLFPCPLVRRSENADPTGWIRSGTLNPDSFGGKLRIILAHGSTQGFGGFHDEEDSRPVGHNQIDLDLLHPEIYDYIALGDWHGMKQVGPKTWYSGTPELDRFPKGDANQPGHVLAVTTTRCEQPLVNPIRTAGFGWHEVVFDLSDESSLASLRGKVDGLVQGRARADLMRLELSGSLGIAAAAQLEDYLESLQARLLRVKLSTRTTIAPTPDEVDALTQRVSDPLIARVAAELVQRAAGIDSSAEIARSALRALHAFCATI